MNQKRIEFAVGIFVLAGIAAVMYLAIQIGANRYTGGDSFPLKASFNRIGGLNEGSNVMIAGVKVGTVTKITLADDFRAIVEFSLDKDFGLEGGTFASIKTNGLLGDKFLSLTPGYEGIPLEAGELIVDTEDAIDIESLISRFAFGDMEKESEE